MRHVDVSPNLLREVFSLYEPNIDLIVLEKHAKERFLYGPIFDLIVLKKTCHRMSNKNKGVCYSVEIQESY